MTRRRHTPDLTELQGVIELLDRLQEIEEKENQNIEIEEMPVPAVGRKPEPVTWDEGGIQHKCL